VTKTLFGKDFEFSRINAGNFWMGAVDGDSSAHLREKPRHLVTISKDFLLLRTETTQEQYKAVMGSNPSYRSDDPSLPVEQVSWASAVDFCNKLSEADNAPPGTYRLPTEAEWEYAARAGSTAVLYGSIYSNAWYSSNSGGRTHPVKQTTPNAWNLYDMLGNVWEWTQDWFGDYAAESATDPTGPVTGSERVNRGGAWDSGASLVRTSSRYRGVPYGYYSGLGFRPLRSLR
jgi:formylglycine-generating enzyme required for sulfatase activity